MPNTNSTSLSGMRGWAVTLDTDPRHNDLPDYLKYSPEKFCDNYGHKPVRDSQAWNLARADFPDNFDAD